MNRQHNANAIGGKYNNSFEILCCSFFTPLGNYKTVDFTAEHFIPIYSFRSDWFFETTFLISIHHISSLPTCLLYLQTNYFLLRYLNYFA